MSTRSYNTRMRYRGLLLLAVICVFVGAAPVPPKPVATVKTVAPTTLPHPVAMFLSNLCSSGKQKITFKAAAIGTRFFFEEDSGVTVYGFDGNSGYRKEAFLKGYTMTRAMKKYGR